MIELFTQRKGRAINDDIGEMALGYFNALLYSVLKLEIEQVGVRRRAGEIGDLGFHAGDFNFPATRSR